MKPSTTARDLRSQRNLSPSQHRSLEKIVALAVKLSNCDGSNATTIPFLSILRNQKPTSVIRGVLTPSFCLIVQGQKRLNIAKELIVCGAGDYIASVIDMPLSGQVVDASEKAPYLAVRIEFTAREIADVITEAKVTIKPKDKLNPAAFVRKSDSDLLELFVKLLKLTDTSEDAPFLGGLIKREIIYRLLSGDYGYLFYQNAILEQQEAGVGKAISWIKENYSEAVTVEQIAQVSKMSVSALFTKFKAITSMSPLQFQKQLRLQEARRLMMSNLLDATTAGLEVGYESPSQFNREYKRFFGQPPLTDVKALRKESNHYRRA
jgi:AraC-like DNA-binding protein